MVMCPCCYLAMKEKAQKTKQIPEWLLEKYKDNKEALELLEECYGRNIFIQSMMGDACFSPNHVEKIKNAQITYDKYVDLVLLSMGRWRRCLNAYFNGMFEASFKGQIEKKYDDSVLFIKLYVNACYPDGDGFKDKEDHVWIKSCEFGEFSEGDCVSFSAEPYLYMKKKGTADEMLDFGLENPYDIKKIEPYGLPTDEDMQKQFLENILLETLPDCMKDFPGVL